MCGIAGGVNITTQLAVRKALMRMRHRGPDGCQVEMVDEYCVGHNLLALRGRKEESIQPKIFGEWVLAFNGQIYRWSTWVRDHYDVGGVDTNVLMRVIERKGWGFQEHIDGMYAIALYNSREKKLMLCRDPSGQKSLYYKPTSKGIIFASELKGLKELDGKSVEIDQKEIFTASILGYSPNESTIYKGCKKLLPGQQLEFSKESLVQYRTINNKSLIGSEKNIKVLVEESIRDHLVGQRGLAINLSGGIDSSLIYIIAKKYGVNLRPYSMSFDTENRALNEDFELAAKLADIYGDEIVQIKVTSSDYFDNFIEAYKTIEEPNYNISLPAYLIMAKAYGKDSED